MERRREQDRDRFDRRMRCMPYSWSKTWRDSTRKSWQRLGAAFDRLGMPDRLTAEDGPARIEPGEWAVADKIRYHLSHAADCLYVDAYNAWYQCARRLHDGHGFEVTYDEVAATLAERADRRRASSQYVTLYPS
jgi:hypothetical protein